MGNDSYGGFDDDQNRDNNGSQYYYNNYATNDDSADNVYGNGYDAGTFRASSNAAVSLREQAVLVKSLGFMAIALFISAVVAFGGHAWAMSSVENMYSYATMLVPALVLELVVYFLALWAMKKDNQTMSIIGYVGYSVMSGFTLSVIFFTYSLGSITGIFVITAVMFAAMAVYGYVTKADLRPLGSFFAMSLIGIIGVGIMNIFLRSSMIDNLIAVVGVVIFAGITAYDIQRLKEANVTYADRSENVVAMYGGLMLYLDFINLFLKLLRLFGKSRD